MVDTEIFLNDYAPKNYNSEFLGLITATEALGLSLNIPSIWLNLNLRQNSLYEMLFDLNLINKSKEFYGDSITLGSAEISLLNLAHLYTIYTNDGILKPLELAGKIYGSEKKDNKPASGFFNSKNVKRSYKKLSWEFLTIRKRYA